MIESYQLLCLIEDAMGPSLCLRSVGPLFNRRKEINTWVMTIDSCTLVRWSMVLKSNRLTDTRRYYLEGLNKQYSYIKSGIIKLPSDECLASFVVGLSSGGHVSDTVKVVSVYAPPLLFLCLYHAVLHQHIQLIHALVHLYLRSTRPKERITLPPKLFYFGVYRHVRLHPSMVGVSCLLSTCNRETLLEFISFTALDHILSYTLEFYKTNDDGDSPTLMEIRESSRSCCLEVVCVHRLLSTGRVIVNMNGGHMNMDNRGKLPLVHAIEHNFVSFARWLIELGTPVNSTIFRERTLLQIACRRSHSEAALMLIHMGADPNPKIKHGGMSPICYAVKNSCCSVIEALIDNGADVSCTTPCGLSLLHLCVMSIESQVVSSRVISLLLKGGVHVDTLDMLGNTPLTVACYRGDRSTVITLIHYHANIHHKLYSGHTLLHLVTIMGRVDLVRLFILRGADINATDSHDFTSLHYGCVLGQVEVVKHLLHRGALLLKNMSGDTPLQLLRNTRTHTHTHTHT
eukprot:GHVR01179438.1.p1 GENE.GHVR01179438.1~~GHVR01179438.1.p1  ORF type:complete len:515 (+),score=87.19 GHVR01179438.1:157-1701(+)